MDRHGVQTTECRFVNLSREPRSPIRNYALQDLGESFWKVSQNTVSTERF